MVIEIFHGQLSPAAAQVYVRVPNLPGGQDWQLAGTVRGPECRHAKTLPVSIPLVDLGAGPTLLARATLTDPCFWSTELPAVYRVSVELRHQGERLDAAEQLLGLRFLGTSGRNFYWAGKRWVLRGVDRDLVPEMPLETWRELAAAMIVPDPPDDLCEDASREGVLLVARLARGTAVAPELLRLARWPAVGLVLLPTEVEDATSFRHLAPNLLLGCDWSSPATPLPDGVPVAFVSEERLASGFPQRTDLSGRAVISWRRVPPHHSLEQARAECDRLQRDLAPWGDFAGYVVVSESAM